MDYFRIYGLPLHVEKNFDLNNKAIGHCMYCTVMKHPPRTHVQMMALVNSQYQKQRQAHNVLYPKEVGVAKEAWPRRAVADARKASNLIVPH